MEGTGERTLMEIKPVYEALHAFEPQIQGGGGKQARRNGNEEVVEIGATSYSNCIRIQYEVRSS